MSNRNNNLYEFEGYSLNARERNLWYQDQQIPLPPKVFDTLLILVENAGKLLSKDDMLSLIWPDSVVEESNLSQNIYTLRQVFGKENKFIETLPRKGYRFIPSVTLPETEIDSKTEKSDTDVEAQPPDDLSRQRKTDKWKLMKRAAFFTVLGMTSLAILLVAGSTLRKKSVLNGSATDRRFELKKLTDTGSAYSPSISPDGKFVAYVDQKDGKHSIRLMDVSVGKDVAVEISGNLVPGSLRFSGDGSELFIRGRGLWRSGRPIYKVSYFGGDPSLVLENVWGDFSISPDGTKIAFFRADVATNKDNLVIRDLQNGEEKILAEYSIPDQIVMFVAPAWSHDGKTIAYILRPRSELRSDISTVDTVSGKHGVIKTELQKIFHVAWQKDGGLLALSKEPEKGRQLWSIDPNSGAVTKVTNDLNMYEGLSTSADGRSLVTELRGVTANVWMYPDADAGRGTPLTSGTYGHYAVADLKFATEERIIYGGRMEVDRDLWAIGRDGNMLQRLTENNGSRNTQITSTSDGRYLFVSSNRNGSDSIWRIGQDGSGPTQITFANDESHLYPALSHNEQDLYFVARGKGMNEIRRVSLSDLSIETVYEAKGFAPMHFLEASPAGNYLAFAYVEGTPDLPEPSDTATVPLKVGLLDIANGSGVRTFNIVTSRPIVRFTNGGRTIDHIRGNSILRQAIEAETGEPQTVFSLDRERIYHFDWSMAGKDIVVAKGNTTADIVLLSFSD